MIKRAEFSHIMRDQIDHKISEGFLDLLLKQDRATQVSYLAALIRQMREMGYTVGHQDGHRKAPSKLNFTSQVDEEIKRRNPEKE